MKRFPWLEALLIAALAVALIMKEPSRVVSAAAPPTAPPITSPIPIP